MKNISVFILVIIGILPFDLHAAHRCFFMGESIVEKAIHVSGGIDIDVEKKLCVALCPRSTFFNGGRISCFITQCESFIEKYEKSDADVLKKRVEFEKIVEELLSGIEKDGKKNGLDWLEDFVDEELGSVDCSESSDEESELGGGGGG